MASSFHLVPGTLYKFFTLLAGIWPITVVKGVFSHKEGYPVVAWANDPWNTFRTLSTEPPSWVIYGAFPMLVCMFNKMICVFILLCYLTLKWSFRSPQIRVSFDISSLISSFNFAKYHIIKLRYLKIGYLSCVHLINNHICISLIIICASH